MSNRKRCKCSNGICLDDRYWKRMFHLGSLLEMDVSFRMISRGKFLELCWCGD